MEDLDYADDVVVLNETPKLLRNFLARREDSMRFSGMSFESSKCKLLWQNRIASKPSLVQKQEKDDDVDGHS